MSVDTAASVHTCFQLFVIYFGFFYVVLMRSKRKVLQAFKQFSKDIGAPDAIISGAAVDQNSQELRRLFHEIGTTLRVLEYITTWANMGEF